MSSFKFVTRIHFNDATGCDICLPNCGTCIHVITIDPSTLTPAVYGIDIICFNMTFSHIFPLSKGSIEIKNQVSFEISFYSFVECNVFLME